jgi:signal transduction histidine kinase
MSSRTSGPWSSRTTAPLRLEPVDLAAVVREVADRLEPQARRAQCPLVVQATEAVVGRWDEQRIAQVVDNLLSNALKYAPGRPVTLRVERRGAEARLIVRDEGIGIAPESLLRIFEKFERAVSPRHYGGLGLYLTRQILQALGGTIRVESQPARGATFTVELPLSGASAPSSLPTALSPWAGGPESAPPGPRPQHRTCPSAPARLTRCLDLEQGRAPCSSSV